MALFCAEVVRVAGVKSSFDVKLGQIGSGKPLVTSGRAKFGIRSIGIGHEIGHSCAVGIRQRRYRCVPIVLLLDISSCRVDQLFPEGRIIKKQLDSGCELLGTIRNQKVSSRFYLQPRAANRRGNQGHA